MVAGLARGAEPELTRTRPHPRAGDPAKPAHWCHEILTAEQERALVERASAGDRAARDELILKNQRLVLTLARRKVQHGGIHDLDDLMSAGNRGLMRAVDKFDPALGLRFTTYAARWVRSVIQREIEETGRAIRMHHAAVAKVARYWKTEARLRKANGDQPPFDRVCDAMGLTQKRRQSLMDALTVAGAEFVACEGEHVPLSFDDPPPEDCDDVRRLEAAIGRLTRRRQRVIRLHYGLEPGTGPGLPLAEIARREGGKWQAVQSARNKALDRLRRLLAS